MTPVRIIVVTFLALLALMPSASESRKLQGDIDQAAVIAEAENTVIGVSTNYQISEACLATVPGTPAAEAACADDAAQLEEEIVGVLKDFTLAHGWETAPVWLAEALHRKVDWSRDSAPPSRHLQVPPSRKLEAVGHVRRLPTCTNLCSYYGCYCCYWCPQYNCC